MNRKPHSVSVVALVVAALALSACPVALAAGPSEASARAGEFELPEVRVVATTPVGGTGISMRQYAGNVQVLNQADMPRGAQTLPEVLDATIGSININDTQGNAYQVDLNYRGFTASPVLGTPQGISVFVDGMRVNEPFGDVVSWDLIPQIAIANLTLVPGSNPVYGLNTLGGAISMTTKSGFAFTGGSARVSLGAFGRRSLEAEQGGFEGSHDYYVALSTHDDQGWAKYNPSRVRQFFGKVGFQDERTDIDVSLTYADNLLFGNQTVPGSLLGQAAQGYTHNDDSSTQSWVLNLRGSREIDDARSVAGNVYYRHITRSTLNSNLGNPVQGSTNDPSCVVDASCPGSNLIAQTTQDTAGANLQFSQRLVSQGITHLVTTGVNAEVGSVSFDNFGQYATIDASRAIVGVSPFVSQALVTSRTRRAAVFASDTFDPSSHVSVTLAGRFDHASIDLAGTSCTDADNLCTTAAGISPVPGSNTLADVSGSHSYQRFNPSIGATYRPYDGLTTFASYAEGFRIPSAIELACADPRSPCNGIPNAFASDPALKPVISHTVEVGARAQTDDALSWRAALFHTLLTDDILFNQTNAVQGYFSNVGQTRRQGLEGSMSGHAGALDFLLAASWVDATFQSPFVLANRANSTCIAANGVGGGCAGVLAQPGNRMPGIPPLTGKVRLGYAVTPATRLGVAVTAQGPQVARGDENNLDSHGKVPGFAVARLDLNHAIDKATTLFAGVTNLFNAHYATMGQLGFNNLGAGVAEQFRGVAAPRAFLMGAQTKF